MEIVDVNYKCDLGWTFASPLRVCEDSTFVCFCFVNDELLSNVGARVVTSSEYNTHLGLLKCTAGLLNYPTK
jgi:hypothetical protein